MEYLFAVPLHEDKVGSHFGKAKEFCFITVQNLKIISINTLRTPLYQLREITDWLINKKVTHVLANGIGQHAIENLTRNNIEVMWGVPDDTPERLVTAYLDSQLVLGKNLCDH
ncbi:MAG: NifB/NifX family molybdenum-iron cluster-binding protein [Bacteroidales bacterium]